MSKRRSARSLRDPRKNWSVMLQALAVTMVIPAAVIILFEYRHNVPEKKEQLSVMSRITDQKNPAYFRELDLRDPARIFGVNGGGFAALRPKHQIRRNFVPAVPTEKIRPATVTDYRPVAEHHFPASVKFPVNQAPATPPANFSTVILSPAGSEIHLEKLQDISGSGISTINITQSRSLRKYRIISAAADNASAERRAGEILRDSTLPAGSYTIIWKGKTGERSL